MTRNQAHERGLTDRWQMLWCGLLPAVEDRLTDAQKARGRAFNAFKTSYVDDYDNEIEPDYVVCPVCKVVFPATQDDCCEHVVAMQGIEFDALATGRAFSDEDQAWMNTRRLKGTY